MRVALIASVLLFASSANAAFIGSTEPPGWANGAGTFVVGDIIAGGGANAISAHYDASTELLALTSNSLPGLLGVINPPNNVLFSLTAHIERTTGNFLGGSYSMVVGVAGVPGLSLAPGTLLLSGSVLDAGSTWSTIPGPSSCGGCVRYVADAPETPMLLEIGAVAPELSLTSNFLTLLPYIGRGILTQSFWENSFDVNGQLGWALFDTQQVAEPGVFALLALMLLTLAAVRTRSRNSAVGLR